jgi:hypothetical protein
MSTEIGSSPHPRLVLAATTLANAMVLVDQTAVPLTLPGTAAAWGYAAAFLGVTLLGVAGVILAVASSRSKTKEVSDLG